MFVPWTVKRRAIPSKYTMLGSMEIAERYVRLAHGINSHHQGFIDSYVGNPVWAENTAKTPDDLEMDCLALETEIAGMTDAARQAFLQVQTRAMRTILRLVRGEKLSYLEEVRGLYDVVPERVPESTFQTALAQLETVLPGSGDLMGRWQALREQFRIVPEHLEPLLEVINTELRARTKKIFNLPEHENIHFQLVQNKPWAGYNWFLGQAVSRVEINTDLPAYLHTLPDLVAHEGYPGHHTERIFKEQLKNKYSHAEHDLQLLNAPEAILAEGIATNALEFICTPHELPAWLLELAPKAGLSLTLEQCELMFTALGAQANLRGVRTNAALMLHQDGATDDAVLEYLQQFMLTNSKQATKALEFIKHARGYIHTYTEGYQLVHGALRNAERQMVFGRLLAEPITPSQLQAMT